MNTSLKVDGINQSSRDYLLKNFNKIIKRLKSSLLISKKSSNYTLTKNGIGLLKRYGNMSFDELPNFDTLQAWTETDLEKLTEKRVKTKFN